MRREMPEHLKATESGEVTLILETAITPELRAEGWGRDTVRFVQQLRKETELNIEDHIHLRYETASKELTFTTSWLFLMTSLGS